MITVIKLLNFFEILNHGFNCNEYTIINISNIEDLNRS